ncbi:MAG: HEAT repeat domain-containing protein [Anaerolineae bacterium]
MGKKRGKRSKAPLSDEKIQAIIDRFVQEELRVDEAEREIAKLRKVKDRVTPRLLEMIAAPDRKIYMAAATLLRHLGDRQAVQPLKDLLRDPRLPDDNKLMIITTLQELGVTVDEQTYFSSLRDPEAAMRHSLLGLLEHLEDESSLAMFVEMIAGRMPPETQVAFIEDLTELGDQRARLLLQALLQTDDEDVILAAIEGLDRLQDSTAIPLLEEVAGYGPGKKVRREARRVAGRLTMRASAKKEPLKKAKPSELPVHRCLLSTIDGNGTQMVFVTRQRPDGYLKMMNTMFNDLEGIKDCIGADMMDEDSLEEMLDAMELSGISAVDVKLERCRQVLEKAHQVTLKAGRRLPPQYVAWAGFLEGEDRRDVEEIEPGEVDLAAQPELLDDCDELLELDEFESWFFNPGEWKGHRKVYRSLEQARGKDSDRKWDEAIQQGLEAIMDDEHRRLWRGRLRCQAWVLAQLYEDEEVWQWAMAAAAALEDDAGVPLHEHPLLYAMMERTLQVPPGRSVIWRE